MTKLNKILQQRDVCNAWLLRGATYEGNWELPCIVTTKKIPAEGTLLPFDKIRCKTSPKHWVHFYIHDHYFEKLWRTPHRYFDRLLTFDGIISPDYSIYRDMPFALQLWNTFRNRAIGSWLSLNGVPIIPNVRWGDERTYSFCFDGIERKSTVAVGTHGCLKTREDRYFFKKGLSAMLEHLSPRVILVYGTTPESIFSDCYAAGVEVIPFPSLFSLTRKVAIA